MGVHGLTTYLNTHQNALGQRLDFPSPGSPIPCVIDAWSFIYNLAGGFSEPWVYGGEYGILAQRVETVVRAWLHVGLKLHFVFDGPTPAVKFPTITSRINQATIQGSLLFFRTSPVARSKPQFLREIALLPPWVLPTCIQTLRDVADSLESDNGPRSLGGLLQLHFADEEGDPFSVELAARLGGYVIGSDSDFVILNTEGYQGYIPMNEMVWSSSPAGNTAPSRVDSDGEFQTVVNSKAKKKATFRAIAGQTEGFVPPEDWEDLRLSVTAYSPARLATHLHIPISLLPLLSALVGNDFTGDKGDSITTPKKINLKWLFFERHLTLEQRITRVATTLRSILDAALTPPGPGKGKQKVQVNSVMQLIDHAVTALMVRSSNALASEERERAVERIVDATLQYAIPKAENGPADSNLWTSPLCALHSGDTCTLVRFFSKSLAADIPEPELEVERADALRDHYVSAYRSGNFDFRLLDVFATGTFWHRPFLENPDYENAARSFARPINEIIYSILDDTFALPAFEDPPSLGDKGGEREEDDEDQLIDVVEDSDDGFEDPLAPLRGALQQLDDSVDDVPVDQAESISSSKAPPSHSPKRKVIVEYVRRGTRLVGEEVEVPSLDDIYDRFNFPKSEVPLPLRSEEDRLTLFYQVLHSDTTAIRTLHPDHVLMALSLRWAVLVLDGRAQSNGSKERLQERWTKEEARAFLASFCGNQYPDEMAEALPPIVDRNVQLVAQVASSLSAVTQLAHVLLLAHRIPCPTSNFSGQIFHSFLTGISKIPDSAVHPDLWDACVHDIPNAYAESAKKSRKKKDAGERVPANAGKPVGSQDRRGAARKGGSMFSVLSSVDV